ncbi:hypothetical protein DFH27DRAFT_523320 [Peziza echinospora]|nr:hypothetical protein DFH27DRAFT_523320 [Peziza echinospora]
MAMITGHISWIYLPALKLVSPSSESLYGSGILNLTISWENIATLLQELTHHVSNPSGIDKELKVAILRQNHISRVWRFPHGILKRWLAVRADDYTQLTLLGSSEGWEDGRIILIPWIKIDDAALEISPFRLQDTGKCIRILRTSEMDGQACPFALEDASIYDPAIAGKDVANPPVTPFRPQKPLSDDIKIQIDHPTAIPATKEEDQVLHKRSKT